MPDNEVYSWVNDISFTSFGLDEQLAAINFDILDEEGTASLYTSVVAGQDGSFYVIGELITNEENMTTAVLARYDSALQRVAIVRRHSYSFQCLGVDAGGDVFVVGMAKEYIHSNEDEWFEPYIQSGSQSEIIRFSPTLDELDKKLLEGYLDHMVIGTDGHVYLVGSSSIVKLDHELVWQKTVAISSNPPVAVNHIAIDSEGAIYVAAVRYSISDTSHEAILCKYDSDLVKQEEVRINKAESNIVGGLAVAPNRSVYITLCTNIQTNASWSIIRYDSSLIEIDSIDSAAIDLLPSIPGKDPWSVTGSFGSLTIDLNGFIYVAAHNMGVSIVLLSSELIPLNVVYLPRIDSGVLTQISPRFFHIAVALDGSVSVVGAITRLQFKPPFSFTLSNPAAIIVK
ncbi:MAG: hypothetical protein FWD45_02055 [Coriobacteriia bacterium]|nr:hypothetical protein [Coriobacteriia bacterium]